MNVIHYSHDIASYENIQMSLHQSNVNHFMAFGIAGTSLLRIAMLNDTHANKPVLVILYSFSNISRPINSG